MISSSPNSRKVCKLCAKCMFICYLVVLAGIWAALRSYHGLDDSSWLQIEGGEMLPGAGRYYYSPDQKLVIWNASIVLLEGEDSCDPPAEKIAGKIVMLQSSSIDSIDQSCSFGDWYTVVSKRGGLACVILNPM